VPSTRDEVRRIARLANLDFTDQESDRFTEQLNAILKYVAQLDRLETGDARRPPTWRSAPTP